MSTYTVTEERGRFAVCRDGEFVCGWRLREDADSDARRLNLECRAEALLALLVESVAEDRAITFGMPTEWIERRDALIAEINGK